MTKALERLRRAAATYGDAKAAHEAAIRAWKRGDPVSTAKAVREAMQELEAASRAYATSTRRARRVMVALRQCDGGGQAVAPPRPNPKRGMRPGWSAAEYRSAKAQMGERLSYRIDEAAHLLGVSTRTVYGYTAAGLLESRRIARCLLVPAAAIEAVFSNEEDT